MKLNNKSVFLLCAHVILSFVAAHLIALPIKEWVIDNEFLGFVVTAFLYFLIFGALRQSVYKKVKSLNENSL